MPGLSSSWVWTVAAALLYGICETMNGNWASILMSTTLGNTPAASSLALRLDRGSRLRSSDRSLVTEILLLAPDFIRKFQ